MQLISFQPDHRPDGQLPYPWHVSPEGEVQQKGFWQGKVTAIIGATDQPGQGLIGDWWPTIQENPSAVVGKHLVYSDADENWYVTDTPVKSVEVREFTDEQLEQLNS